MMDESRLLESQASVALMRSRDDRKTEEERNTLYQDYVSLLNKSAGALAGAAIYQNIINALTERRNATVSRSQDIQQQINEAEKKSLKERTDSFDEIYEQAARDLAIRTKEAEAIRDQINPLRARIREQERLNELVEKGNLKPEELNAFYRARADKTVLGLQSRIPQALQVNTGTSALGGTFGSGPANQIIDIQKGILDGIRQLVRMEMLAGAN
jgi:hypothetical protein